MLLDTSMVMNKNRFFDMIFRSSPFDSIFEGMFLESSELTLMALFKMSSSPELLVNNC